MDSVGVQGSNRWSDSNRTRNRTPLGAGRTCPRFSGDDCDSRPLCLADNTYSRSEGYLLPAAFFLPSQVPFSVSLDHLPESSPFLSLPVNW